MSGYQRVGDSVRIALFTNLYQVLETHAVVFPLGKLDRHDFITVLPLLEDESHIVELVIGGQCNTNHIALLVLPCRAVVLVVTHNGGAALYLRFIVAVLIGSDAEVKAIDVGYLQLVDVQVTVIVVSGIFKQLAEQHLLGIGKGRHGSVAECILPLEALSLIVLTFVMVAFLHLEARRNDVTVLIPGSKI